LGFSGGISYKLNRRLSIEASYLFLRFDERKIDNSIIDYSGLEGGLSPLNGVYNSTAHLLSISFSYKLN
ncbi:MAG: hypothetical protein R3250_06850, partial [Melioribacteraceae bacterium]|nr:hypothetical protein [Melioribacteraceae bacterium]